MQDDSPNHQYDFSSFELELRNASKSVGQMISDVLN